MFATSTIIGQPKRRLPIDFEIILIAVEVEEIAEYMDLNSPDMFDTPEEAVFFVVNEKTGHAVQEIEMVRQGSEIVVMIVYNSGVVMDHRTHRRTPYGAAVRMMRMNKRV